MSPWSARSTWAVELHRNCSALVLSPSSLRYSPWEVTPLGAARNQKAPYSNKRYAQRHVQKAPCHCLYKGSDTAEILQDYCAKLNMIFGFCPSLLSTFLFTYLSCARVKPVHTATGAVAAVLLHTALCKAQTHTGRGQTPARPTQSSDNCAAETLRGKSRATRGKGAQTTCQRCPIRWRGWKLQAGSAIQLRLAWGCSEQKTGLNGVSRKTERKI